MRSRQAAIQYLLETSWAEVRAAQARERRLKDEARRRSNIEKVQRQSAAEQLVELCDCPFGAVHGMVFKDSTGRVLRRGDHLMRGAAKQRQQHHGIFYGGTSGSEVIHHAKRVVDKKASAAAEAAVAAAARSGATPAPPALSQLWGMGGREKRKSALPTERQVRPLSHRTAARRSQVATPARARFVRHGVCHGVCHGER